MGRRLPASRSVVVPALAGLALAASTLGVALLVAEGEARGHAFFHLLFGAVGLAMFAGVGLRWPSSTCSPSPATRTFLLAALGLFAFASMLEALGASGYDRFNDGRRIEWLTTVHGVATAGSGIAFLLVPLAALGAVASSARARARARRAAG